jgi:hypothetical protein
MTTLRDTIIVASNNYSKNNSGSIYISSEGKKWDTMKVLGDGQYRSLISYNDGVYISTTNKVYFSNDMCKTWTEKSNGLPDSIYISSLVATDVGLFTCGNSFFRSIDNGNNWIEVKIPGLLQINSIAYLDNTLIACTKSSKTGLYRSVDNGVNWTYINSPTVNGFNGKLFVLNNIVVAAPSIANGYVFYSFDKGTNWSTTGGGLNANGPNMINTVEVYHGIMYAGTLNGVFVSNNYGQSWTSIGCWNVESVCIKDNIVYAGTPEAGLWTSSLK